MPPKLPAISRFELVSVGGGQILDDMQRQCQWKDGTPQRVKELRSRDTSYLVKTWKDRRTGGLTGRSSHSIDELDETRSLRNAVRHPGDRSYCRLCAS